MKERIRERQTQRYKHFSFLLNLIFYWITVRYKGTKLLMVAFQSYNIPTTSHLPVYSSHDQYTVSLLPESSQCAYMTVLFSLREKYFLNICSITEIKWSFSWTVTKFVVTRYPKINNMCLNDLAFFLWRILPYAFMIPVAFIISASVSLYELPCINY